MDTPVAMAAAEENKMIMLNASRRVFFYERQQHFINAPSFG